ncbi:partial DNA topoisomerase 1, partial [Anaerolineae bacterium]
MPNKLLLVESPVKAQKLQSFLSEEWRVEATFGHVCDFPRKKMGIEIQAHFKPTYLPLPEKTKLLARIKQAAEQVEAVYIGMNADGEGDSIAWHTLRLINLPNQIPVYRLTLSAITAEAVKAALKNPTALDRGLMEAEETRRIMDRLVSYNCSPAATKLLKRPVRVERLEAFLLRMLVEREQQIEASEPSPRYVLSGKFQVGETPIEASLTSFKEQSIGEGLRSQSHIQTLMRGLEKGVFWIGDVQTTQETLSPPPPFTMSSLFQLITAFDLPISSVRTVIHALYEGGWITFPYPRNETVPPDATASVCKWIEAQYGADYLPDEKTVIAEGMRPTNCHTQPEQSGLTGNALVLYTLIWKRFVASH